MMQRLPVALLPSCLPTSGCAGRTARGACHRVMARSAAIVLAIAACSCGGAVAPSPGQDNGGGADGGVAPSRSDSGIAHLLSDNPICPQDIPAPPTWTTPGVAATGGT